MYKFHCFQDHYMLLKTEKMSEKIQNGQKWPFQIFSDNFSQKDKNGHSIFFLTIFSKKTGTNLFGMTKNGHSNYFLTIFLKKTGKIWNG